MDSSIFIYCEERENPEETSEVWKGEKESISKDYSVHKWERMVSNSSVSKPGMSKCPALAS